MPESPATAGASAAGSSHARYLKSLPRRTYPLRVLGLGLGALPVLTVLHELGSPPVAWAWAVLALLAWPHLAVLLALRSADPFRAELRNFVFDSFLAGSLVPLMHYNLLPSVVLVAVVLADKLNTGIRGLWWRSLPGMAGAIAGVGLFTGFAVQPASSMPVVLASLPILVIHTLVVSLMSYDLVRRVQRQNVQLEQLSRIDALTGVFNLGHWEPASQAVLDAVATGRPAYLLVVDVDAFKEINDAHGHVQGDDVLRAIGALLLRHAGDGGVAGRLGGDEFALAVPLGGAGANALAERLRSDAQALRLASAPHLRCSISIGLAAAAAPGMTVRQWREAADRALYRAKQQGRNRVESEPAASA